jgi:hypothetical protein
MEKQGNRNSFFPTILPLAIAGISIWGFLLSYFYEAGILKYYNITTRFIKIDVSILPLSWRAFVFLIIMGAIALIKYIFFSSHFYKKTWKYNDEVSIKSIIMYCLHILPLLAIPLVYLYIKYWIAFLYIHIYFVLLFFLIILIWFTFIFWKVKKKNILRNATILIIIFILYTGGIESSFINGYNFAKHKEYYYTVAHHGNLVVINENNDFILCSKYNSQDSTLDSSIKILYFSSDTSITLNMVKFGNIKQR